MLSAMFSAHFTHQHWFENKICLLWNLSRITEIRRFGQEVHVFNNAVSTAHFSWCQTRLKIYKWQLWNDTEGGVFDVHTRARACVCNALWRSLTNRKHPVMGRKYVILTACRLDMSGGLDVHLTNQTLMFLHTLSYAWQVWRFLMRDSEVFGLSNQVPGM
jgi:hypothetical protein